MLGINLMTCCRRSIASTAETELTHDDDSDDLEGKVQSQFPEPAGEQTQPQSIGLANGNILTVWEDDTGGSSPGNDIMGQMFDPYGNSTGPVFQVNDAIVNQDETWPQIRRCRTAATSSLTPVQFLTGQLHRGAALRQQRRRGVERAALHHRRRPRHHYGDV